jgi:putative FmdB family regulatory protein
MRIFKRLNSRAGLQWSYTSVRCSLLGECCFMTCFRRSLPVPTYEYECLQCERRHEVFQNFSDDPLVECPDCSGKLTKVFHPAGVIFKGGGWYVTDSRSGSEKKQFADDGKSPSSSEDSKPVKSDDAGEKSSKSTSANKSDTTTSKAKADNSD